MAKTKDAYQEMLDLLSPEERENIMKMTGQDQGGAGSKTPVVKINYNRTDVNGKKVTKGNYVLGQKNGTVDGKQAVLEIGTDLGESFSAVILKSARQYSYFSMDAKKRCTSQLLTEKGEVPFGSTLKCNCQDKSCPRRKEGLDKAEKCSAQFVVFLRLPEGSKLPDGTPCPVAMMYVKGSDYMPFQTYMQEGLKGVPSFAVKTKFTSTEEGNAVVYYVKGFEKGEPVTKEEFKENFSLVSGVNKQILEYKEEQSQKLLAGPKGEEKPAGSGKDPIVVNDDDNITW